MTKLLIVGGVAGGASAAARARRVDEKAEIILFERGEHVSFANCGLPYYIGGEIEERDALFVATPELFITRFNIDVRTMTAVESIDRDAKKIKAKNLLTGETYEESYDKLILAPGAAPIRPPLAGVKLDRIFTLRNVPDTDAIKAMVDSGAAKSAVIVGGGYIGLEMAENLVMRGVKVTIVEMLNQVMAPVDIETAAVMKRVLEAKGVELRLGEKVEKFEPVKGGGVAVHTDKGAVAADMVLLAIGVRPESDLARDAGLTLGARGGIVVDESLRTSDPDIFAVGDAVEVTEFVSGKATMLPLAGPANKQGRIAADNALGRSVTYKGALGTSILKLFDLVVAITGINEKMIKQFDIPYDVSFTHSGSNAGYYPGAQAMSIKLLFSPGDGRILGAQIAGGAGVDKRIDVIAAAIRARMTVFDLEELDLAYAPPFSSAKDPVNMAGFVAANILKGDVKKVNWHEVAGLADAGAKIIDVRNPSETRMSGMILDAVNIPLPQLRAKLGELDAGKRYLVYCGIGLRSYIACRILTQNGFDASNISGGFTTYSVAMSA